MSDKRGWSIMLSGSAALRNLNACKYLYLVQYTEEPEQMNLHVLVHEARTESEPVETKSDNPAIEQVLGKGHPI
ncbi:MAG TPA: hypothetical protein VK862_07395 [Afifellaceae bacterium]|nr:hypothetical protein [Afifellaceae bacterium]